MGISYIGLRSTCTHMYFVNFILAGLTVFLQSSGQAFAFFLCQPSEFGDMANKCKSCFYKLLSLRDLLMLIKEIRRLHNFEDEEQ